MMLLMQMDDADVGVDAGVDEDEAHSVVLSQGWVVVITF